MAVTVADEQVLELIRLWHVDHVFSLNQLSLINYDLNQLLSHFRTLGFTVAPSLLDNARPLQVRLESEFPLEQSVLDDIFITAIYEQGGIVSSVCHGIAGLLNVKDSSGVYLISGKAVTGFTKAEEILAGKLRVVPFLNREEVLKRGGLFRKKRFYSDHSIQDGRLITGQNPFSVRSTAKMVIKELTR